LDADATDKLAFLDNIVAVYRGQAYKDGTDKVIGWEWEWKRKEKKRNEMK